MSGKASENNKLGEGAAPPPDWYAEGLEAVWLPYAAMRAVPPPLPVVATAGSRITLADGRELIDGLAAWWTACHGYNHPHIRAAVERQLAAMPHVMFSGLVHEPGLTLARRLLDLLNRGPEGTNKGDFARVFFSESGSVSVEIALKIAVQFWINRGQGGRNKIVAFRGGYHGDTTGTMAVSDPATGMHGAIRGLLPEHIIVDLPTDEARTAALEKLLAQRAREIAAIIVEPLVQGAGGMHFHDASVLQTLRRLADRYDLLLIFDEIFTGFGRTGSLFAMHGAGVAPDIVTLSKALTGGTLPLAATVVNKRVFEAFWSADPTKALMHGPTFMANALACAAANASLGLFEREDRLDQVARISFALKRGLEPCRALPAVKDVRVLGAIGVVEMQRIEDLNALRQRFIAEGVFIRPFGSIVYLTPAFTISAHELNMLVGTVLRVVRDISD
jgi:adenosylmethionine---8-amino-7-oxononanoate aminotransferase